MNDEALAEVCHDCWGGVETCGVSDCPQLAHWRQDTSKTSVTSATSKDHGLFPDEQRWGHNIRVNPEHRIHKTNKWRCHGWCTPLPKIGDTLRMRMQSQRIAVMEFVEIRPCDNPRDMFFGEVEFVRYLE